MRAKQIPSSLTRSKSQILLLFFSLSLILLSFLFFLFPPSDPAASSTTHPYPHPHPRIPSQTSFIASLEHFLTHKALNHRSSDDTVRSLLQDDVRMFDDRKFAKEMDWVRGDPYYPLNFPIRVYVYQMPNKFTYDLLWLFRNTYRETSNLTSNGSPVHRIIEQHSIDYWLWADLIAPESERLLKNVVRVDRQEEADLFYMPFFTTISFFLLEKQQCKALYREALKWVTDQPAWKRSEGRDHIFPIHHPWSFKSVRRYVKNSIWLLPDMDSTGNWYKPGQVSLEKDLILPYVPNVDLCDAKCVSESESKRTILLFFRGRLKRNAGGKIRSKLVTELAGAKDVVIEEGTSGDQGKAAAQKGMRRSIFCLSPAGDTPSSARLFDAIVSGCIPVIISDELELPFEGILDYRKIAIFVSLTDAVQPGWLLPFLKGISSTQIREMRRNLVEYSRHFMYSSPAQPLGPEDLVWRMMGGKLVNIKLHTRRSQRVVKESRSVCTCDCRSGNNTTSSTLSGQSLSG
ncbi:putative arabinosyltransferase ARAD1 isoform X1 [Gossypium australe]|uniref:Putative arabinosyltransferase ARAD1 isoform X1 n=1 Tax=Gossypium australe TaxID=47621 RepID=A0A5B6UVI1_9ROSI|nr:putative arabinosyltransferase ARAD1 isoform X1 [Gossypium australe]